MVLHLMTSELNKRQKLQNSLQQQFKLKITLPEDGGGKKTRKQFDMFEEFHWRLSLKSNQEWNNLVSQALSTVLIRKSWILTKDTVHWP